MTFENARNCPHELAPDHYGEHGFMMRIFFPMNETDVWYPRDPRVSDGVLPSPKAKVMEKSEGMDMCCSDGCGTNGWFLWSTKEQYCPVACGYCYQGSILV